MDGIYNNKRKRFVIADKIDAHRTQSVGDLLKLSAEKTNKNHEDYVKSIKKKKKGRDFWGNTNLLVHNSEPQSPAARKLNKRSMSAYHKGSP